MLIALSFLLFFYSSPAPVAVPPHSEAWRARGGRDVLDDQQILALAVTTRYVTNASTFFTTDITGHAIFLADPVYTDYTMKWFCGLGRANQ
jgi:hypothetical protein